MTDAKWASRRSTFLAIGVLNGSASYTNWRVGNPRIAVANLVALCIMFGLAWVLE